MAVEAELKRRNQAGALVDWTVFDDGSEPVTITPGGLEARLDYDGDNKLIYVGKAPNGTPTSAATWTVQKLTWTGSNLTRVQVLQGSWDGRAGLSW